MSRIVKQAQTTPTPTPPANKVPCLHHDQPKAFPKYKKLAAFDIETDDLYGPYLLGAIMLEEGDFYTFETPEGMIEFMLKHPDYDYYAHNGSGYDFNYLLEPLRALAFSNEKIDIQPIKQGDTRVIAFMITFSKKKVALKDSLPLLNSSLKKAAEAFAPDMPKLDIGLAEGVTFNPQNPDHMSYLKRDCETLIVIMQSVRRHTWEQFHCKIGLTAGSTAMNAFKASIPDGRVYYRTTPTAENFLRQGYYGGYVFPGKWVGQFQDYTTLDYTGAYAGQMKYKLYPIGRPIYTFTYVEGRIGFYRVICTAPKTDIPCVPCRTNKGVIYYQDSTFETVIDSETLAFAQARGYRFVILEGYYFVEEEDVFTNIITLCEALELSLGGVFKALTKLIRNALYGKFGTREEVEEIRLAPDLAEGWGYYIDPVTGMDIDGVQVRTTRVDAPYIQLQWAALVTARQRMTLIEKLELLLASGSETVYGDTDSVIGDSAVIARLIVEGKITTGIHYGELKHEHDFTKIIFLGPKCYGGSVINEAKPYVLRAKGVPNKQLMYDVFTDALSGKREKKYFKASNSVYRRLLNPLLPIRITNGRNRTLTNLINSEAWEYDPETKEIFAKRAPTHGILESTA